MIMGINRDDSRAHSSNGPPNRRVADRFEMGRDGRIVRETIGLGGADHDDDDDDDD